MTTNVNNYTIGKGIVWIKNPFDSGSYAEVGNVSKFTFQPQLTTLDHFDSQSGIKTKDLTVLTEKKGTLTLTMDEWTADNLALAVYGENVAGTISILSAADISVAVKIVGTNDVGPKYTYEFLRVKMLPNKELGLIADSWGELEINGDVLAVAGEFGTITPVV